MKAAFLVVFAAMAVSAASAVEAPLGTVEIINGTIVTMNIGSVNYGGMSGKVTMKLGSSSWTAESIWLLPQGSNIEQFKYSGSYYSVPSSANMTNNCRSSVYFNQSAGYAFKASVEDDGSYCILADPGTYRIVAEY